MLLWFHILIFLSTSVLFFFLRGAFGLFSVSLCSIARLGVLCFIGITFLYFFRLLPSRCIQPICFFLHHGTLSAYNVSVTRSTLAFLCYCQSNCNSCCICTYVCFSFGFARGERTNVMQIAKVRKS